MGRNNDDLDKRRTRLFADNQIDGRIVNQRIQDNEMCSERDARWDSPRNEARHPTALHDGGGASHHAPSATRDLR
jgi:hypothetical protein